ncbi:MAG: VWA domain-containing protein [Thermodesulfobacteriota bacterium]|nr:VWA domain-containing protein [Thermodesulfobacteriota bacterium]
MSFAHPMLLHLLWVLPLVLLAVIVEQRKKTQVIKDMVDDELVDAIVGRERKGVRFFKAMFLLAALACMLFALAGPRWGSHIQEVSQKGVDIMVALDVSPSMEVQDIKPSRLVRARHEVMDFMRIVRGDRVGLVVFSGAAFVQCPLTLDYGAIEMFLSQAGPDLVPVSGTDLGAAIEKTLSCFDFDSRTDKVIILITDGEDNEGQGLAAAKKAAAQGVRIFVFGIGDPHGGPVPAAEKKGFATDPKGKIIMSKLDEKGLMQITEITGGVYVRSVTGDLDLDTLYFDGINAMTKVQELKSEKIRVYEERFLYFLLAAFILLLLEGLMVARGRHV